MEEQVGTVTMKGNPLTLVGNKIEVGAQVPRFKVIGNDMSEVECTTFEGKLCKIAAGQKAIDQSKFIISLPFSTDVTTSSTSRLSISACVSNFLKSSKRSSLTNHHA